MTDLIIRPTGEITTLYTEVLDLTVLGTQQIERASHVEPDDQSRWWAAIINGPRLGPFERRSDALTAEVEWLCVNRLGVSGNDVNLISPD